MPKIRAWTGQTSKSVTGKLIRDTGTGLIVEDDRGVRYFARYPDVIEWDSDETAAAGDLFGPI